MYTISLIRMLMIALPAAASNQLTIGDLELGEIAASQFEHDAPSTCEVYIVQTSTWHGFSFSVAVYG